MCRQKKRKKEKITTCSPLIRAIAHPDPTVRPLDNPSALQSVRSTIHPLYSPSVRASALAVTQENVPRLTILLPPIALIAATDDKA
jgi:hypothetical protein